MIAPAMLDDQAFQCLRTGDAEGFLRAAVGRNRLDFSHANLRGADMRNMDLSRVILRGAYLRDADLRGQYLSLHDLNGTSIKNAKISGALFPADISAEEIRLSVQFGTCLRSQRSAAIRSHTDPAAGPDCCAA